MTDFVSTAANWWGAKCPAAKQALRQHISQAAENARKHGITRLSLRVDHMPDNPLRQALEGAGCKVDALCAKSAMEINLDNGVVLVYDGREWKDL